MSGAVVHFLNGQINNPVPFDIRTIGTAENPIGQARRSDGEIAFHATHDPLLRVVRVATHGVGGTGERDEPDRAGTAIYRLGAAALVQVPDTDHRHVQVPRQPEQRVERPTYRGVLVAVGV